MGSHFIRGVLVLCLALAVGFVPTASPVDAQGKGTVKIATQSPLSGGQAALGEGIKLGTQLGCAEMIRSGITCFADMYYFEETVAQAAAAAGMRALCGQTVLPRVA